MNCEKLSNVVRAIHSSMDNFKFDNLLASVPFFCLAYDDSR